MIVDTNCNATSESFGLTEFCSLIHNNSASGGICASMWKQDSDGIYVCPSAFATSPSPSCSPTASSLARCSPVRRSPWIRARRRCCAVTVELGIPEPQARQAFKHTHRKTQREMEGAYELLRDMIHFFVEKNYSIWLTNSELKNAPTRKDCVLSQITQIMYSYNLTVDRETDTYTLITGTGIEHTETSIKSTPPVGADPLPVQHHPSRLRPALQ